MNAAERAPLHETGLHEEVECLDRSLISGAMQDLDSCGSDLTWQCEAGTRLDGRNVET